MRLPADKLLQNEYQSRLNRAIDYILNHYDEDLNLDRLSEIACFSKFHFHRLFHAMIGETLNDFVQRIRLEKSVHMLTNELNKSITEIALDCGFSCSQNYAKAFKARYGVTPSAVRKEFNWDELKIKISNLGENKESQLHPVVALLRDSYYDKHQLSINNLLANQLVLPVKITKMPDLRVAYMRSRGPYTWDTIEPVFQKLYQWAAPRGLINENTKVLSVVRSRPITTPEDKLIHDACITVPDSVKADRWVNVQTLPGGELAIYHCETNADRMEEAWLRFVLSWLISSNYQPDDRPLHQIYYSDPATPPLQHQTLDLCLPIKPLFE